MKRILAAALLLAAAPALQAQVQIGGGVFGGGRMADVGGTTSILVKGQTNNTTTLSGVYGGNDIAGSVNGANGSTIVVGADAIDGDANGNTIVITDVYGGGNGYYQYPGLAGANTGLSSNQTQTTGGAVKNFDGSNLTDEATVSANASVPAITKTNVSVKGSAVKITNLFGGAKNAFVTNASNTTASISIENGTITSAFGGNNYGGAISGDIAISVTGTVEPASKANASYSTVGTGWGIKRLYGGGNKVPVPGSVVMNITGGWIDTCFAGGNAATVVTATTVTLNTAAAPTYTHGTNYDGVSGFYNIRYLYGGNNSAVMDAMPTLNLTKGGVGTVYGGGKSGDMRAGKTDIQGLTDYALSTYVRATSNNFKADVIFGGCQQADVRKGGTYVAISGGEIGTVYGGCNISGFVVDTNIAKVAGANVKITGGHIMKNVYGGGNGLYGFRDASTYKYTNNIYNNNFNYVGLLLPVVNSTTVNITGGTIEGNVYAGGELAPVGVDRTVDGLPFTANNGSVALAISESNCVLIKGNVYGGGRMAPVYGSSSLSLNSSNAYTAGTSGVNVMGNVYGGNDIAGSITVPQNVTGSDSKVYNVATSVKLYGAVQIDGSVFGGGNGDYTYFSTQDGYDGSSANNKVLVSNVNDKPVVDGGAIVDVNTGSLSKISKVYGGGNNATVNSSATVLFNVAEKNSSNNVDTIFGGNNLAVMSIMPNIDLQKGYAGTVYGGGNKGAITCTSGSVNTATPSRNLSGLSTYVLLSNHTDLKVTGTIYGGCRVANVSATAYVDLAGGTANDVFGGNDVGGSVNTSVVNLDGDARVEGSIYGGGNGKYYYNNGSAYEYANHSNLLATNVQDVYSNNTEVKLTRGNVTEGDVYGGGLAGDCGYTDVVIEAGASVDKGTIYGGGCGDIDYIGASVADHPHVGNVDNTASLTINGLGADLHRAFGGGRAGDVASTEVVVKDAVNRRIHALYGGCVASNLTGTSNIQIGQTPLYTGASNCGDIYIDTLYGGNDFSGRTQNTSIVINQGTFRHVFGAGNGDYDYKTLLDARLAGKNVQNYDTVPYSMNVNVVYNGGYFIDRVFGGGNMGLVGDKSISYANHPEGDNNSKSNLYGYINVDIHNGYFNQHVFAGARGSLEKVKRHFGFTKPTPASNAPKGLENAGESNPRNDLDVKMLAYAYKQLNMDGGVIRWSLYGGSEAVDDGYPYECWDSTPDPNNRNHSTTSSMRPSTVLNIVGGSVMNRVYGGGYRGNVYGSIYVNVGQEAVVNSPVWVMNYHRTGSTGTANFHNYLEKATALNKSPLYLLASIYNGSDWGEAGQNEYFDTRGFFGGIGLIFIDGEGYQTSISRHSMNPEMQLNCSIIGSGTSTSEADVNSRIIIRNYGDFYCPSPSRSLKSVQRTNRLFLHNVYVSFTGEQDAFQSYTSSSRSFCRIDTMICHEQNLVECKEPGEYVGYLRSEDIDSNIYTSHQMYERTTTCTDEGATSSCDLLSSDVTSRNVLLLDNGIYFQIFPYRDVNGNRIEDNRDPAIAQKHDFGELKGWMYLMAPNGTRASVMSRPKDERTNNQMVYDMGLMPAGPLPAGELHGDDGGFVCPCSGSNKFVNSGNDDREVEYGYVVDNGQTYRTWTVGTREGERRRHITLVAHADPSKVTEDQYLPTESTTVPHNASLDNPSNEGFAYAKATMTLPPSNPGNYYTISSVSVDDDNGGQVRLVDHTYDPDTKQWVSTFTTTQQNDSTNAKNQISANPNYVFGLELRMRDNFDHAYTGQVSPNNEGSYATQDNSVVSGNVNLTATGGFYSKPIGGRVNNVLPTLDFVLTYKTDFTTTVTRDVVFRMEEYASDGSYVGPVDITVTISTVMTDFNDLEAPVLAMFNEDTYDKYVRKVIIPASFLQRNLYLEEVRWAPTAEGDAYGWASPNGPEVADANTQPETRFNLQPVGNDIDDYKHFSITITPTQDVTDNISNSLGWYDIQQQALNLDIYSLGDPAGDGTKAKYGYRNLVDPNTGLGMHVGVLDGRAAAAFDVTLNYEGSYIYEDVPDLAHLKLKYRYVNTQDNETDGTFWVNIKVRTRESGDTIYMAEPAHFYAYTVNNQQVISTTVPGNGTTIAAQIDRYDGNDLLNNDAARDYHKNDPKQYLSTFPRAIDVYDEGDVICIMDPIHVNNNEMPISVQGADYSVINIIRYTGSHFHWPGERCAHRGPMIVISNGAKFTASNVRFDGGGVGRKALAQAGSGTTVPHEGNGVEEADRYVMWNGQKYQYFQTEKDTTFVNAPIFWVEDGSRLNLRSYNTVINNFNKLNWQQSSDINQLRLPGGAIGAKATTGQNGGTPTIILGNQCNIYNHVIVDHSTSTDPGTDHRPGNFGAAIYSDGAIVTLGNGKNDNIINASENYYLPESALGTDFEDYFEEEVVVAKKTDNTTFRLPRYKFIHTEEGIVPCNIYLTRTRATSDPSATPAPASKLTNRFAHDYEVTYDNRTDLINVVNQLSNESHIGVSKWFPGYIATDDFGRDTIGIVNYAVAGSLAALTNYGNGSDCIYTDDSAHVIAEANPYRRPANDIVDVRYSSLLNTTKIFLHRCGTFVEEDIPIVYGANPDVVCPGDGDTIWYKVKGGAANYTYTWELNDNGTWKDAGASVTDVPEGFVVPLGLSLAPNQQYRTYSMRVTATEGGGCQKTHNIDVLVKRVGSNLLNGDANTAQGDYAGGKYDDATGLLYSRAIEDFMGGQVYPSDPSDPNDPHYRWPIDTMVKYPAPGARYISSKNDELNNNNTAKAVRCYSYYTIGWEVIPAGTGTIAATSQGQNITSDESEVCPGDQVHLTVTPNQPSKYGFVMWDDDPSLPQSMNYTVIENKAHLKAYLAPNSYWWQTVTSDPGPSHFRVEYHGKVHIYDSLGLAWFISTTNGLNGQQARSYAFDTIVIEQAALAAYNMTNHKWTPLGTTRVPFRGHIEMASTNAVNHLVVSEDDLLYAGMFGYVDSARIDGLKLRDCVFRTGNQGNAGGVAGFAGPSSAITNCDIDRTNTITAPNCAGGIVGAGRNMSVVGCSATPSLVGNTTYAGDVCGYVQNDGTNPDSNFVSEFSNNAVNENPPKVTALYFGGVAGAASGQNNSGAQGAKSGNNYHVRIANNTVHVNSGSRSFYVGGLVGDASGVDMENNYVYGTIEGFSAKGGLVGLVGNDVSAQNCYYANADAKDFVGGGMPMAQHDNSTFTGEGNQVTLADSVEGTSNLTLALNRWVRNANASKSGNGIVYKTWRSDLENVHDGYPIFGTPDQIPIYDTVSDVACDSLTWFDNIYTQSGTYSHTVSDTANFVDSITVMNLTVHYSQSVELSDSVELGRDYVGENFSFTAEQIFEMLGDDTLADVHTLQIVDSLLTENGCDSVITFNLTIYGSVTGLAEAEHFNISVYPNPTAGKVEVKAEGLQRVELYDAVSRKVMDQQGFDGKCLFDLSSLPTGSYYLRIHSAKGTAVKKVVKR